MHLIFNNVIFLIIFGFSFSVWAQLPFVQLSANGAANAPNARYYHSFDYDNNGGFFIFGGDSSGFKNDLWRFNRDARTFTFVDGSTNYNTWATIADKPTARRSHASWVDNSGNLWILGGLGYDPYGAMGLLSDTWVYKPSSGLSNKWTFVTGSKVADQATTGTLGPRFLTGQWRDVNDNCLYVFAGDGPTSPAQPVWKLNPALASPTWQLVDTSNETRPGHRYSPSCDGAPTLGAYCFGGWEAGYVTLNDLWQFNPTSNPKWTQITQPNGPSGRFGHELLVNRAAGKVYVLFGLLSLFGGSGSTDIYSFGISTQEWSTVVSSSAIPRVYFGADFDNRNMIHYFGGSGSGTYNDVVSLACLYGEINNAGTCNSCPVTWFSTTYNAATCNTCAPGYQPNGASCVACSKGTFKQAAGAAICSPCEPGTYQAATGKSTCIKTPVGTFQDSAGQISFKQCTAGTFQNQTGQSSCLACAPGTFQNATAATNCIPTAGGTFQNETGATSFKICPIGTFSNASALSACIPCSKGSYTNNTGSTNCTQCPLGTSSNVINANSCEICASGSYSSNLGSTTCQLCPAGSFGTDVGATNNMTCIQCPVGSFSPTFGASSNNTCTPCSPGTFSSIIGANSNTTCQLCPLGTFSIAFGAADISTCISCPINTFNSILGGSSNSSCIPCPDNMTSGPGSASCSCNIGFQYNATSSSCVACAAGYFKNTTGNWTCSPCPQNTFLEITGATSTNECRPCPHGSNSTQGSASCMCNVGFEPKNGASCAPCTSGTYKETISNQSCSLCPANTFSNIIAATTISVCQPCSNKTVSLPGSSACVCDVGHGNSSFTNTCTYCPTGHFKAQIGNMSCTPCPENQYSVIVGATSCISCGGNSGATPGSSFCSCNAGYFSSQNGSTCDACPAGTFKHSRGNSTCELCKSNSNSTLGSTTCSCNAGYQPNAIDCVSCLPGTFKSSSGNFTCSSCPANTYSTTSSSTTISDCLPCRANSTSVAGSSVCFCDAGFEYNSELLVCVKCEGGTFKSTIGNEKCSSCPPNTVSSVKGATTSEVCQSFPTPTPTPPGQTANPLAAAMGVSDTIFFVIVGSVGAVLFIAIVAAIFVKRRLQKNQNNMKDLLLGVLKHQSMAPGMMMIPTNNIIPGLNVYGTNTNTNAARMSTMMSMPRIGTGGILPPANGMTAMLSLGRTPSTMTTNTNMFNQTMIAPQLNPLNGMTATFIQNGTTARAFNGKTWASQGPQWSNM